MVGSGFRREPGGRAKGKRIDREPGACEGASPVGDQVEHDPEIDTFALRGVGAQAGFGEAEEGVRGSEPVFFQVHEGAGELDQALVKLGQRTSAFPEPEVLQDVVGLVIVAPVEAGEPSGVTRVEPLGVLDPEVGDAFGLRHGREGGRGGERCQDGSGGIAEVGFVPTLCR